MGILELVEGKIKEEGLKQGLEEGLKQGLKQGEELTLRRIIEHLLRNGSSVQQVVDMLAVPEDLVQKIHDELSDNQAN
jgi:predicted transposase YdaD